MAKARLFISTDMQMMSGVNNVAGDKDDVQSLIHALLYQDKVNIVGIASTTSKHQPGANDDSFILRVIDAYAQDHALLAARDGFKSPEQLRQITYQGTKALAGAEGYPAATAASQAIIAQAMEAKAAGEVLYVATWGGLGDVARALHDAPQIASSLRLLSASGPAQEPNAYTFIKQNFAGRGELWWIDAQSTQLGVYAGPAGKTEGLNNLWAVDHAKGHGALGELFFSNTIDVKGRLDDFDAVKMGDSWTTFYLIDTASNDDPAAASWGGRYQPAGPGYWIDRKDQAFSWSGSAGALTTFEHRAAWQADLAGRLDWLTAPPAPAPVIENDALAAAFWRVTGVTANSAKALSPQVSGAPSVAYEAASDLVAATGGQGLGQEAYVAALTEAASATSAVAVQTYRVLAKATPSPEGLAWLVDSPQNPADLTDAYYAQFNLANRYINLSVSLAQEGPGAAQFSATYGPLSFEAAAATAYETVIGRAQALAAGLDPDTAIGWLAAQRPYFEAVGGSQLGAKAALVGQVIYSGATGQVGREYEAFQAFVGMAAGPSPLGLGSASLLEGLV